MILELPEARGWSVEDLEKIGTGHFHFARTVALSKLEQE